MQYSTIPLQSNTTKSIIQYQLTQKITHQYSSQQFQLMENTQINLNINQFHPQLKS